MKRLKRNSICADSSAENHAKTQIKQRTKPANFIAKGNDKGEQKIFLTYSQESTKANE